MDRVQWVTRITGLVLIVAILGFGLTQYGFALNGWARGLAWLGCALLGVVALPWLLLGKGAAPSRRFLLVLLVVLGWTALQNIPMGAQPNPAWKTTLAGMASAGVERPVRLPLALDPEAAGMAWDQTLAATCFFAAAAMVGACGGWRALAWIVAGLSLLEGFLGLGTMILGGAGRASGGVFNPNHHAALTLAGLPLAIAFLWNRHEDLLISEGDGLLAGRDPGLVGVALVMAAALGWMGAFSRGSLLLGVPAVAGWLCLEWWRARQEQDMDGSFVQRWGGAIAVLVLVAIGFVAGSGAQGFGSRLTGDSEAASVTSRPALAQATYAGLVETKFLGLGMHGAEPAINRFADFPTRLDPIYTHNDWVQFAAEMGAVGIVLLLVVGGWLLLLPRVAGERPSLANGRIRRAAIAGLASLLLHAFVDFHLRIPLITMMALLLTAIILTPTSFAEAESAD